MQIEYTPFHLYRVSLRGTRHRDTKGDVSPFYSMAVIGQAGRVDNNAPISDDEREGVEATLASQFAYIEPESLSIERDEHFTAYQPSTTEHFVCVTINNAYFFMNKDRLTVGSPLEIFGEGSLTARSIRSELNLGTASLY